MVLRVRNFVKGEKVMPLFTGLSAGIKTILLAALSILASLNLSTADKSFWGRILIFIGAVFVTEATIEARDVDEKSTMNQMETLENEMACLCKQMEELKKKFR